jgi:alpha-D-ribose 1-methylphosphonate 5-triphosphate diphosphatase
MGAPNVMRGLSYKGNMSAEDAICEGICTVLASDYFYPSLLHAAEHLVRRDVCPMSATWDLIIADPTAAMGLTDRGSLKVGNRADVVVVDCAADWGLVHTIVLGAVTSLGA